jgi:hypothetical protein
MDKLGETFNSFSGGNNQQQSSSGEQQQKQGGGGGFLGSIGDKFNSAAGGGKDSEKNEDYLDKGSVILFDSQNCPSTGVLRKFKLI